MSAGEARGLMPPSVDEEIPERFDGTRARCPGDSIEAIDDFVASFNAACNHLKEEEALEREKKEQKKLAAKAVVNHNYDTRRKAFLAAQRRLAHSQSPPDKVKEAVTGEDRKNRAGNEKTNQNVEFDAPTSTLRTLRSSKRNKHQEKARIPITTGKIAVGVYHVEKIVNTRVAVKWRISFEETADIEYQIKWTGWPAIFNNWEPNSHLDGEYSRKVFWRRQLTQSRNANKIGRKGVTRVRIGSSCYANLWRHFKMLIDLSPV